MKFLIDQQLPRSLARWIVQRGHEATHIRDLAMEHAEDRAIWREAATRGAVIVTKDEDFSVIVRRGATGPAVIWVRLGNCGNERLMQRFEDEWDALLAELQGGALLIELR